MGILGAMASTMVGSVGGGLKSWRLWVWNCSVAKSCPTLCNSMDCSTPSFHVLHHLLEFAQTHVHWVGDAIQLSHSLSLPSAFNLPQHQGLFQWVSSSHQVTKWIFRIDFLYDWLVWSPCYPRDSQKSYPTPQFKSINSSVLSLLYSPLLTSIYDYCTGKTIALTIWTFVSKMMPLLFNTLSRLVIAFLPGSRYLNFMAVLGGC